MRRALSGNQAAAWGFRLSRVSVYPYYPITPSSSCSEQITSWVSQGEMDAVTLNVESEHSAASAIIAAGKSVRAGTATASKGLLYMLEVLENAAGASVPFVMFLGNRATGAPINIWGDHSDAYAARDSGAIQIFAGNAQEALDDIIQAYRIAEDVQVRQPVIVNLRGFTGTHTYEGVDLPSEEEVEKYLPPFIPWRPLFAPKTPVTYGAMLSAQPYRRHKRNQSATLMNALAVAEKVGRAFGQQFGRQYGLFEWVGDAKADLVVAVMGESAGVGEVVTHHLQGRDGIPGVALLKIRLFTPFPAQQVAQALWKAGTKALVVFEEGLSHGAVFPPLAQRIASALQVYLDGKGPRIASVIGGLGGSEVSFRHFQTMFNLAANMAEGRPCRCEPYWLDIKEDPILLTDETESTIDAKLWKRDAAIWREQRAKAPYHGAIRANTHEIRIIARAGQGAITTAVFFTAAGVEAGFKVITKPTFGSERRGSIVHADTVIDLGPGHQLRFFSGRQDVLAIYDDTILTAGQEILSGLKPGGIVLVNSARSPDRIREILAIDETRARVFVVQASRIAHELGLGHFFNLVMLGALHRVDGTIDLHSALEHYEEHVPDPRAANLEAIRRGFEETSERAPEEMKQPGIDDQLESLFHWRPPDPWLV